MSLRSFKSLAVLLALIFAGCADSAFTSMQDDASFSDAPARMSEVASAPILRNPQFLENAYVTPAKHGDIAWGKGNGQASNGNGQTDGTTTDGTSTDGITYVDPDLLAIVDLDVYEADGITRRILDENGVSRRILDEYGVTRRVLEEYGVTRRVLEEYGVTRRVLEEYGITRRILDDYGVTRRIMDEYGITEADFDASFNEYLADITLRVRNDGSISVRIRGDKVTKILLEMGDDPDIEFVEPDPAAQMATLGTSMFNSNDDQFVPYGIDRIAARSASATPAGTHVYVLDSGILDHPDLRVRTRKDFTMLFTNRDQEVWDDTAYVSLGYFDPGTAGNPADDNGHGTHIAGTIGAKDNREGVLGVFEDVTIHSLKVLTADGRSDVTTIVAAIDYVRWQKANVHISGEPVLINLSLGMDTGSTQYNILDDAVQKAIDEGIVVVVSAGNDAEDASNYSPAHVADAITVGAYDHKDEFSDKFSNYGPAVDLLAPGHNIVSLPHLQGDADKNWRVVMTGTSMAAPHVTGAAAMYMAANRGATPAQVQQALKDGAQSGIIGVPSGTTDKSVHLGFMATTGVTRALTLHAAWDFNQSTITLRGDMSSGTDLTFSNADTGEQLARITSDRDGNYLMILSNVAVVPCSVAVEGGGQNLSVSLANAPLDCDDGTGPVMSTTPVTIGGTKYIARNRRFRADGTGPAGFTHTIYAADGSVYASVSADEFGGWAIDVRDVSWAPCSIMVSAGGQESPRVDVDNAPSSCR
jgi:subtilisin family serine protease